MEYEVLDRYDEDGFEEEIEAVRAAKQSPYRDGEADGLAMTAFELLEETDEINEHCFDSAQRYVFAREDDEVVGMASIRASVAPQVNEIGEAMEIFHLAVREDKRGNGYGEACFEAALEEAEELCGEENIDSLYLNVQKRMTDLYAEVTEELSDRNELRGEQSIVDYCLEEGIDTDRLAEPNEPMEHLAAKYGFEEVRDSLTSRKYVKSVSPVES